MRRHMKLKASSHSHSLIAGSAQRVIFSHWDYCFMWLFVSLYHEAAQQKRTLSDSAVAVGAIKLSWYSSFLQGVQSHRDITSREEMRSAWWPQVMFNYSNYTLHLAVTIGYVSLQLLARKLEHSWERDFFCHCLYTLKWAWAERTAHAHWKKICQSTLLQNSCLKLNVVYN